MSDEFMSSIGEVLSQKFGKSLYLAADVASWVYRHDLNELLKVELYQDCDAVQSKIDDLDNRFFVLAYIYKSCTFLQNEKGLVL